MADIITPNQNRFLEPYKQKVYQYDTAESDLFLSRYTNTILKIFGDDCVLTGMELTDLTRINSNTGIEFTVNGGRVIQDLTYVNVEDDSTGIQIEDVNMYDDHVKLIVYLRYCFLHTIYENPLQIRVSFYDTSTNQVIDGWDPKRDRIILGLIGFAKDGTTNEILSVGEESFSSLNVEGSDYEIRPEPENTPISPVIDGGEI